MGEYFMYVNLDRHEYFMVDVLGGATKAQGVGRNLGARALGLLLMKRGGSFAHETSVIGSWASNRIAVAGDYTDAKAFDSETTGRSDINLYSLATQQFKNIGSTVALMLLAHDGEEELIDVARSRDDVFVLLGELAFVHRSNIAANALTRHFGPDWIKSYAEKRKRVFVEIPPP